MTSILLTGAGLTSSLFNKGISLDSLDPFQALFVSSVPTEDPAVANRWLIPDNRPGTGTGLAVDGAAVQPDGADDNVDITGIATTGTNWSFSGWFKSTQTGTSKFLCNQQFGSLTLAWCGDVANQIAINTGAWHSFGATPNDGNWHYLTFVFTGATGRCFLDGVQFGTDAVISPMTLSAPSRTRLFSNYAASAGLWQGTASQIRFDEIPLTLAQHTAAMSGDSTDPDYPPNATCLRYWSCEDYHDTLLLDSSDNGAHGTKGGITTGRGSGTFHYQGSNVPFDSLVARRGYTLDPTHGVIPARLTGTLDALGATIAKTGPLKRPGQLKQSYCATLDGFDDYWSVPHLTGAESVVSHGGTTTPTISAGRIDFTAGTVFDLLLSDGSHFPCAEGAGNRHYNTANAANVATVMNATTTAAGSYWATTKQDAYHYNILSGFTRRMNKHPSSANTSTGWTKSLVTVTDGTADPEGSTSAIRIVPSDTTTAVHRTFRSGVGASDGDYVIAYVKQVGTSLPNVRFEFSTGSAIAIVIATGSVGASSAATLVSHTDVGGGWYKLVIRMDAVGTNVLQMGPTNGNGFTYTPSNTVDGADIYFAVTKSAMFEVKATTGTAFNVDGAVIPAPLSLAVTGFAATNPAGVKHNGCETKIDFTGGVAFPGSSGLETAWAFNTARTSPRFKRNLTSSGSPVAVDRMIALPTDATAQQLTDAATYTTAVEV